MAWNTEEPEDGESIIQISWEFPPSKECSEAKFTTSVRDCAEAQILLALLVIAYRRLHIFKVLWEGGSCLRLRKELS